nr:hypothetical protein CFP56_62926 [Quercus suber]
MRDARPGLRDAHLRTLREAVSAAQRLGHLHRAHFRARVRAELLRRPPRDAVPDPAAVDRADLAYLAHFQVQDFQTLCWHMYAERAFEAVGGQRADHEGVRWCWFRGHGGEVAKLMTEPGKMGFFSGPRTALSALVYERASLDRSYLELDCVSF